MDNSDEQSLFLRALDCESDADLAAFLDEACRGDQPLRRRIETLLDVHQRAGNFLEQPALPQTASLAESPVGPGTHIGPYKLLEQIGEGGMGVVYMAEQQQPVKRKVALKLIKPGMDTRQVVARFEAERQALALMDHPNIARVFDGGTVGVKATAGSSPKVRRTLAQTRSGSFAEFSDGDLDGGLEEVTTASPGDSESADLLSGRPYFVMELVRGIPITDYCNRERLNVEKRLTLFNDVCRAVQHAHQKGIIHRDLKPSNVLITLHDGVPVVKVIDFGVAKALNQELTERTLFTQFAQMVGTPLYMSPEQAELSGIDVDTRSDIYSLGVLMYELLTDTTPFERETLKRVGFDGMRRMIRDDEPHRPSARVSTFQFDRLSTLADSRRLDPKRLRQLLRGELDWIVMKALDKDRNRRYESASAFAADIERYLRNEPVEAGPPSIVYRLRKAAARNRGMLAAVCLVVLALVTGTALSLWQALEAHDARRLAEARSQDAHDQRQLAEQRRLIADSERDKARRAKEWSRTMLYAADMKLASDAAANHDVLRAAELLERHVPDDSESDLRGFEWHFQQKRVTGPDHLSIMHSGPVNDLCCSPDGRWLAASTAGAIRIYEAETGQLHRTFTTGESVNGVDWSQDSPLLAAACADGRLRIWNVSSGEQHLEIGAHDGEAYDVVFGPGSSMLYSCGEDNLAAAWNLETGGQHLLFEGHERSVERIALAPDGTTLATAGSDETFALWDTDTARRLHRFDHPGGRVVCVAFSPDGRFIAAGNISGHVYLADCDTGQSGQLTRQLDGVEALAFFADGQWLATADRGGALQLHPIPKSIGDGQAVPLAPSRRWMAHEGRAQAIAVSPDGKRLISGGRDALIRVWTLDPGAPRWSINSVAHDMAIDPVGRIYALGHKIDVWDLNERRLVDSFAEADSPWLAAEFVTTERALLLTRTEQLALYDVETGRLLREWPLEQNFKPDRLAVSDDRLAAVADSAKGKAVTVFDLSASQPPRRLPALQSEAIAFAPGGLQFAASHQDHLRIYDQPTGQLTRVLAGHSNTLADAAFSPAGDLLATVGHDRLLKIWTTATGEELFSTVAQRDRVRTVAFSPDGRTIATAGDDAVVRFWHTATGQPLGSLPSERHPINKVRFSSDGWRLVALLVDRSLVVYDALPRRSEDHPPNSRTSAHDTTDSLEFRALGDLPGGRHRSIAEAVSPNGRYIVGYSSTDAPRGYDPFRWSGEEGMRSFDRPDKPSDLGQAFAVSDDGRVVCGAGGGAGRPWSATLWTGAGSPVSIAPHWSVAEGLSADGSTIVGRQLTNEKWSAFRRRDERTELLDASPQHQHAAARAVTADGTLTLGVVFDQSGTPTTREHEDFLKIVASRPVIWDERGLRALPGFDESRNWWPLDLSDDGSVVVGLQWLQARDSSDPVELGSASAFVWSAGRVTLLGTLPGYAHSHAHGVSGDGRTVVGSCHRRGAGPLNSVAFVWDADRGMRDLNEVLARRGLAADWHLSVANDVSRDGTTIVGSGRNPNGRTEAWRIRLPRRAGEDRHAEAFERNRASMRARSTDPLSD